MIAMTTRTIAYIYHGNNTPPLKDQVAALASAGVKVHDDTEGALIDSAPSRDCRKSLLDYGLDRGDTLILAAPQIIGSGKVDTAKAVRRICVECGSLIQIAGYQAKAYLTEAAISGFTKDAVSASLRLNGQNAAARRSRSGPRGKLEDLTEDQWAMVRWLYLKDGVKQSVAVEFCNEFCGTKGVNRVNIFQRIQRETQEK